MMRPFRPVLSLLLSMHVLLACGQPLPGEETEEGLDVTDSSQALTLPADGSNPLVTPQCAARRVDELSTNLGSGPGLFISCESHPLDPHTAQGIRVKWRDAFNGTVYTDVNPDFEDRDGRVCVGGVCRDHGEPLVVENTCGKQVFYKCPCGIAYSPVAGSAAQGARCVGAKFGPTPTFPVP